MLGSDPSSRVTVGPKVRCGHLTQGLWWPSDPMSWVVVKLKGIGGGTRGPGWRSDPRSKVSVGPEVQGDG